MKVFTDFPSGSADVLEVDPIAQEILFQPERHERRGYEGWWHFKLSGLRPGQPVTVRVTGGTTNKNKNWAWINQAALSEDGVNWELSHPGEMGSDNGIGYMQYEVITKGSELWCAYAVPYLPADARALAALAVKAHPGIQSFDLCYSEQDRAVPALRICESGTPETRFGVWLMARCHAWESGTSWTLHGLCEWLLSDDDEANALRRSAEVTMVPIMDADSVVLGRSGKSQRPRDHARDWDESPYWASVAASMQEIRRLSAEGRFDVLIDIHGPGGAAPYFIVPTFERLPKEQRERFSLFMKAFPALPRSARKGNEPSCTEYTYDARTSVPTPGTPMAWALRHTVPHVVAATLEISMVTPLSTREGYRLQGETLGRGIARYCRAVIG